MGMASIVSRSQNTQAPDEAGNSTSCFRADHREQFATSLTLTAQLYLFGALGKEPQSAISIYRTLSRSNRLAVSGATVEGVPSLQTDFAPDFDFPARGCGFRADEGQGEAPGTIESAPRSKKRAFRVVDIHSKGQAKKP
jgi:hypothetical protein